MATFDMDDEPVTIRQVFADRQNKPEKPENQAFARWAASREPQDLRSVVQQLEPTISHLTRQYVGMRPSPVVQQRARLLAARAIESYNPAAGANLTTHVSNHLKGLQRMAADITDPMPPPERFRRDQAAIVRASDELEDELGREVTDEEVAERTGMPIKRVLRVRGRMRGRVPMSVVEDSDYDDMEAPDIVGSEFTRRDEWVDAVYHDLGPIDKLILAHKTGFRGFEQLSTGELARRLNISPAAVSQRASRIQARLEEFDHGS